MYKLWVIQFQDEILKPQRLRRFSTYDREVAFHAPHHILASLAVVFTTGYYSLTEPVSTEATNC